MQASLNKMVDFLDQSKTQFVIPIYQRNYGWSETQCRQLLRDIKTIALNDTLPSHFVGSIVFIHDSLYANTTAKKILTIIDGQQRLTTITLLLLSLAHKLEKIDPDKAEEIIENNVVNKRFEEKEKLKPILRDNNALIYLIQNDFSKKFQEQRSKIIENYLFFKTQIDDDEIDLVLKGVNKLFFVEI